VCSFGLEAWWDQGGGGVQAGLPGPPCPPRLWGHARVQVCCCGGSFSPGGMFSSGCACRSGGGSFIARCGTRCLTAVGAVVVCDEYSVNRFCGEEKEKKVKINKTGEEDKRRNERGLRCG
jgi:hypothetical protein